MAKFNGLIVWCFGLSLAVWISASAAFQGKIVNGTQAIEGEFPFIISLRRAASGRHSCGGSILNRAWVLTAAHCVSRAQPEQINVQYGSSVLNPNTTHVVNVSKIFVHKGYLPSNRYIHDIAMLKLQTPITFKENFVSAVRLPEMLQVTAENESAILIGWGLNAVSLHHASNNGYFCAGTIIHATWILTAAHCLTYIKQASKVKVQFESMKLYPKNPKYAKVKEMIIHEGYNPTIKIHDIALLELEEPLKFEHNFEAVELTSELDSAEEYHVANLIGWGLNETMGSLQAELQKVQLQVVPLSVCRLQLSAFLHETNLCAGTQSKGQCSGDSGGPLLINNKQIGIVSWSLKPCASHAGVFTKIAFYTEWINREISSFIRY